MAVRVIGISVNGSGTREIPGLGLNESGRARHLILFRLRVPAVRHLLIVWWLVTSVLSLIVRDSDSCRA